MLWACFCRNAEVLSIWKPLLSGTKENVVNQRWVTHARLSVHWAVPKTGQQAWGFRFWMWDFSILPFPYEFSTSDGGDISVHLHEVRKVPTSWCRGLRPCFVWVRSNSWVSKLEQSIITPFLPHFMHRDRYPIALRPDCPFFCWFVCCCFFGLFSRWNLRCEVQKPKAAPAVLTSVNALPSSGSHSQLRKSESCQVSAEKGRN